MTNKLKYAIGIDLGGTYIKLGIVTDSGKIVKKVVVDTMAQKGPDVIIAQIKKGIKELLDGNKLKIHAIGVGCPGVISTKRGTVENPPNLPGWDRVNLVKILEKATGKKVYIENDANAAAIGEYMFGAGKKYNSFVMITLGTGVGGGIILKRKIYRGEFGAAGEIGHITIDYKGPKCNCGSYGCIETYIGNHYLVDRIKKELSGRKSIIKKLVHNDLTKLTPKTICEAAKAGDSFAQEVVKEMGVYLGAALASISNVLDIGIFIIGGGVSGFGKPLFDAIEENARARVLTPLRKRIKVIHAKLKNDAGIKGASALVFYK
ncbi:MAG: ROK family protein [Ignavibacteriaceae bacterium]|nr:ROK family protein [Ignavibacteriaceae bacterium]